MSFINYPLFILLALAVIFGAGFTAVAFRARKVIPGGVFVMGVGISVVIWAGGYFIEMITPGLDHKLMWANLKQLGSVLLPFSFLLFALVYTRFIPKIPRFLLMLLTVEPILVLIIYWNDSALGLMRINPALNQFGVLNLINFEIGHGLVIHFIYSALLSVTAVILLLVSYFRAKSFYRKQISFILLGMSIPFLGALAVYLNLIPPYLDVTPLLLGISFPIMSYGLYQNEFFKIAPVNPQSILDRIPFGFLVVDMSNDLKIISLNTDAEAILAVDAVQAIGKPVSIFLPALNLSLTEFVSQFVLDFKFNNKFYKLHCERITGENYAKDLWLIIFLDHTAQKNLEESLFASEAMYRSLIENSIEGIAIVQNETIVFLNQQMASMLGYLHEELLGLSFLVVATPEFLQKQAAWQEIQKRDEIADTFIQGTLMKKDGQHIFVEASWVQIPYREGELGYLLLVRDITNRKKIEEERDHSLALFESTIETSNNGILVMDINQNVLAFNQRQLAIWDLPAEWIQLSGDQRQQMMMDKLNAPETLKSASARAWQEITAEITQRFYLKNGNVLESYTVPFYVRGDLIGRLFVSLDITEIIQQEEQLRASEAKYRLLAENASDVIWSMDLDGKFTYVSPSVFNLRGYTVEEVMGQPLEEVLTEASLPFVKKLIKDIKQSITKSDTIVGMMDSYYLEQPCKNGDTVWTEVKASLLTQDGKIVGIQGVSRDITERRAYEKELEKARLLAEDHSSALRAALKREKQLHDVTRTISRSMEIETVLSELLRQTLEITNADEAHLGLIDHDGKSVHFKYGMDRETRFTMDNTVPQNENCFSWQVINLRQGLLINHKAELEKTIISDQQITQMDVTSLLGVPVLSGLTVLGVLTVFSKTETIMLNEHDLHAVEAIAAQAGIAIQNARLFEEINQLAITDPLTRLYNRRYFFNLAKIELDRAKRYGSDLSIIMMDIDDFKRVNDTFGHLLGDEVLVGVAEIIRNTIRKVDMAARYGGEEMVILMPATSREAAITSAERLRIAVETLEVPINAKSVSVSISLGVSSFDQQMDISISKLLDQADQAMYLSKQHGKNQVSVLENS